MSHPAPNNPERTERLPHVADGPPVQIPDHQLLRCIGRGSYGVVWLAKNIMGSFRAVKIVYRKTFHEDRPFEREFSGIERFEPISRSHPGFVCVLHVGRNRDGGYFYYVMEVADDVKSGQNFQPDAYMPKTLSSELLERQKLPMDECISIGLALTSALSHLHRSGLIHRDIKPSNIIFSHGQPKFADIGLVTTIGESVTFVGTEGYVPPEGPGQPLADIFSLGKLLYEALMGQRLQHFAETAPGLGGEPRFRQLHALILAACHLDPAKRPQSAEELHAQLASLSADSSSLAPRDPSGLVGIRSVALIHQPDIPLDNELAEALVGHFSRQGIRVEADRRGTGGLDWARQVEKKIAAADAAMVLISPASIASEVIACQLEMARDAAHQRGGKPALVCIRVNLTGGLPDPLTPLIGDSPQLRWDGNQATPRLLTEITAALNARAPRPTPERPRLETVGGAVPLDSAFYVIRPADGQFETAIRQRDSIVLIKGARQMGKTSLLARGLQVARQSDLRVLFTDYQKLNAADFASLEKLFLSLAESIADQLDLDILPGDEWDLRRSPNRNFERYLRRHVLDQSNTHFIWGMDEVDRLFTCSFSSEVFALFRSWHNQRALEPSGPWSRVTLAIAYATEAHLFISDLVQSPFNVGTRLVLEDFTAEQVADLNGRYGRPLRSREDLAHFLALVGGQPFLVRRGLHELATHKLSLSAFEQQAAQEEGIFGDHLRRILVGLVRDPELLEAVRVIVRGGNCPTVEAFYRLRAAGLIKGDSPRTARPRCDLYGRYLGKHLL
ncbi:MAG: AAA-like domain-containing protein [Verrucomicrobiota bacterium]